MTEYPSFRRAIVLLVIVTVAMFALQLVVALIDRTTHTQLTKHPATLATIEFLAIGLALLINRNVLKRSLRESFSLRHMDSGYFVAIAITIFGATILISEAGNFVIHVLPPPKSFLQTAEDIVGGHVSLWGSILAVSIVAPVMEELLFRGVILSGFLTRYSVPKAIILSALLFGLFHLNPWQLPGATALGALFGWWYVRTGSLVPCIYGHCFNNSMLLAATFLAPNIQGYTTDPSQLQYQPIWLDLVGVAITGAGLWLSTMLLKGRGPAVTQSTSAAP